MVKLADLKPVNVGHWPEVSVKNLYNEFITRTDVALHCPPTNDKKRPIDKTYLFNIINTFHGDELQKIIRHANAQRNSEQEVDEKRESIMMCEAMSKELFMFPHISVSNTHVFHSFIYLL